MSLERDLLRHMLQGDLDIALRMAQIGDLASCQNAIENALTKIAQIKAISPPVAAPRESAALSSNGHSAPAIDI